MTSFARFDDAVAGRAWVFSAAREVFRATRLEDVPDVLRSAEAATAAGGWAYGYVGYEAAAAFDDAFSAHPPDPDGAPLAWFAVTDQPRTAPLVEAPPGWPSVAGWEPEWPASAFRSAVRVIRAEIGAGGLYQCNLTTRLEGTGPADPVAAYAAMVHAQRGAYHCYLDLGRHVIASASPEMFFYWADGRLLCRPMKGTARRGTDTRSDERQRTSLLGSEKERAENLMIVDLVRNDLARVAEPGTVRVERLFHAERYPTVWQLTSDVSAEVMAGADLVEIFAALFPPASVTGAPKLAATTLIRRLEPAGRGVYCGAIGMLAPPGAEFRARFSVAIRTMTLDRATGRATYGTGSGITFASSPEDEWAETLLKGAIITEPAPPRFRLLETMRYDPGHTLRNLDRHLRRLAASASYFGFGYDESEIRAALAALDSATPLRVRLLLDRAGLVDVGHSALAPATRRVIRLAVDTGTPAPDRWCRHKTTHRDRYSAAAERHPDADDVVLTHPDGRVVETTVANLAVRRGGRWITPSLDSGCLPGVERAQLIDSGRLIEADLTVAELRRSEAVALVSSLRGWRGARLL